MEYLIGAICYLGGIISGIIILRYGIGIGSHQVYWQKEDIEPFSPEDISEMEQTHTGGRFIEEEGL